MFVREAFLDKASRVAHILGINLGGLRIPLPWVNIRLSLSMGSSRLCVGIELIAMVLADDLLRSLFNLSDLHKRVLVARNSILFAGFTEVSVATNCAHIADSLNRVGITSVTGDIFMDNLALLLLLFFDVVKEHVAECFLTVILDLLAYDRGNSRQLLGDKSALSVALAAGKSLLVDLGTVTLDASNLLKIIIVIVGRNKKVTSYINLFDLNIHLAGLVLHLSKNTIAAHVTHISPGLASNFVGYNCSVNHLLGGLNSGSIASCFSLLYSGHDISTDGDAMGHSSI